jgi:hypothetical protein
MPTLHFYQRQLDFYAWLIAKLVQRRLHNKKFTKIDFFILIMKELLWNLIMKLLEYCSSGSFFVNKKS